MPDSVFLPKLPNDGVDALVAAQVDGGRTGGGRQCLDRHAGGQREACARGDGIDALAGAFDDHVECIVDHVAVVARPAFQKVRAGAAVEDIVAAFRAEIVVPGAAIQHIVAVAGFVDRVVAIAAKDGIVACRAIELIASRAAIEHIVPVIAEHRVVECIAGAADVCQRRFPWRDIRGSSRACSSHFVMTRSKVPPPACSVTTSPVESTM